MNKIIALILLLVLASGAMFTLKAQHDGAYAEVEKATTFFYLRSDSLLLAANTANEALAKSASTIDSASQLFISAMAQKYLGERSKAEQLFRKSLEMAGKAANQRLENQIRLQLASYLREERKYKLAETLIPEVLVYFQTTNDSLYLFRSFNENGLLYFDQGRLSASLHHFLRALSYIPSNDQTLALADVSKSIGAAYLRLGQLFNHINPQKASQYFLESSHFNHRAQMLYDQAGQLYGSCICRISVMEAAMTEGKWITKEQLPEDISECWNVPDYFIQISLLRIEAKNASIKGNHLQAIETLQKAGNNKYRLLAPLHFYHARLDLAVLLRNMDSTVAAYNLAYEAASWFEERGVRLKSFEALNHLALWHEQDGQIEKALELSKKASLFKNLLVNESDMEIFDELRYKYQTEELQTQLQKAVEKERRQRKQWLVTLAVFGWVAVILILLLLVIASKRKKALLLKQLAEEKSAKLAEETKVKKLELEHIKTENELIQQKVAANVLLVEKKEQELLLNALRRTEVLNFQNAMVERLLPFVTKLNRKADRDAFESLLADLRNESDTDPIQQFETVFKQAYGSFYTKLAETAPDLSRSEIQVAVLLRLNLTSKEIAHILCLTTATVERTRHQLRQKLNLEPNQQLVAWLMGLG